MTITSLLLIFSACSKENIQTTPELHDDGTTMFIPADQKPSDWNPSIEDIRQGEDMKDLRNCCRINNVEDDVSGTPYLRVLFTPSTAAKSIRIHHHRRDGNFTYLGTTVYPIDFEDTNCPAWWYIRSVGHLGHGDFASNVMIRTADSDCSNGVWHSWSY